MGDRVQDRRHFFESQAEGHKEKISQEEISTQGHRQKIDQEKGVRENECGGEERTQSHKVENAKAENGQSQDGNQESKEVKIEETLVD